MDQEEDDELRAELDPGIADLVMYLREAGWRTVDSGDGESKGLDPLYAAAPYSWTHFPHVIVEIPSDERVDWAAERLCRACAIFTGRTWIVEVMGSVCFGPTGEKIQVDGESFAPMLFAADAEKQRSSDQALD